MVAVGWRLTGRVKQAVNRSVVAVMVSRVHNAFGMSSSWDELILHNLGNFTIVQVRAE